MHNSVPLSRKIKSSFLPAGDLLFCFDRITLISTKHHSSETKENTPMLQKVKNRKAAIAVVISLSLLGAASMSSCSTAPADTYTGKATIQSHKKVGKSCRGNVLREDGTTKEIRFGVRSACDRIQDGQTINLTNDSYRK